MRIRYAHIIFRTGLVLTAGLLSGQDLREVHFKGVIHDYSPSTVAGGPYEMRGDWSLDVQRTGTANFTADLAMETSDYGTSNATKVDPANPATRGPHTHHISVTNAAVSYDVSVCPANSPATTGPGIVVTATVTTTGNGSPAPFESQGASTMQVCITGGSTVSFSNITLVYKGPATGHFGTQAIHGVVSRVSTH
ncbi:MAG: hypothetical protein ABI806_28700 [Candidatus Solibacter sp.]